MKKSIGTSVKRMIVIIPLLLLSFAGFAQENEAYEKAKKEIEDELAPSLPCSRCSPIMPLPAPGKTSRA